VSLNALLVVHRRCIGTIASEGNASELDLSPQDRSQLLVVNAHPLGDALD
jgi:hypothetical protein